MKVRTPYFGINTKSYMYGEKLVDFCKELDKLAVKYDIPILVSSSFIDCARISAATEHVGCLKYIAFYIGINAF